MQHRIKGRLFGAVIAQVLGITILSSFAHFAGEWTGDSNRVFAQELVPIGQLQGRGSESPYLGQRVGFRGIVTGLLEDQNTRGTRFYTVYVQDMPGEEDGDTGTSDGIAIFAGARRPGLAIGDVVVFNGTVTEYFGLTELDNNGLLYWIESRNNSLPEPVLLEPPADNEQSAAYLERFESMRVSVPVGTVVGPSHVGCGFSVVPGLADSPRVVVSSSDDAIGRIIGALHPSDVNCADLPAVATGDVVKGLIGPLTYHFERFKIVYQVPSSLSVEKAVREHWTGPPVLRAGQFSVATFNVNNLFDDEPSSDHESQPVLLGTELALKQAKVATAIGQGLGCPDLVALQEVENEALLLGLAERLTGTCGYEYQISHRNSPDARGADLALLSNPERIVVDGIGLRQVCSDLDTGIIDAAVACSDGQQPLFSRPPLQVAVVADGHELVVLDNHFKSKRGGAAETAERRVAQAAYVNSLVREMRDTQGSDRIIVLGDFNDYDGSSVMQTLTDDDVLVDALLSVSPADRYSYIFDGASQLIDWILVTPTLADEVVTALILHINADYPVQLDESAGSEFPGYRSSDHDIPFVIIDLEPEPAPAPPTTTVERSTTEIHPTARPEVATPTVESSSTASVPEIVEGRLTATGGEQGSTVGAANVQQSATPESFAAETDPSRGTMDAVAVPVISGMLMLGTAVLLLVVVKKRQGK